MNIWTGALIFILCVGVLGGWLTYKANQQGK